MIEILGAFLAGAATVGGVWFGHRRWSEAREAENDARQHTPPSVMRLLSALTAAISRGESPKGLFVDGSVRRLRYGLLRMRVGAKLEEGWLYIVDPSVLDGSEEELFQAASYAARCPGMDGVLNRHFHALACAVFAPAHRTRIDRLREVDREARALEERYPYSRQDVLA